MAEINERKGKQEQPETVDIGLFLHDMLRGFRKFWYIGLILALLLGAFGAIRQVRAYSPQYRCEASFTVNTQQSANENYSYSFYYDQSTTSQLVATFPYIRQSDLFNDRLLEKLGRSYVGGSINATSVANSNMFTMTVTSSDPNTALEVLEAALAVYPDVAVYVLGDIQLNMIDAPRLPEAPYNRLEWVNSAVKYALLGVFVFLGLLALYALTRNTVRRESEMEKKLQLQSLGIIPMVFFKKRSQRIDRTLSIKNDKTGFGFQESFRGLGLRVASQLQEHNARVLGVTAGAKGEGVTTVSLNLARSLSEAGKKVIFIDGHFYHPTRKVKNGAMGLESYLTGQCQLSDILSHSEKDRIWTIACGRPLTEQELVQHAPQLRALMEGAKQAVDYVIIDLPPFVQVGQAVPALELCDALMLVIRQDTLKLGRIMDCVEDLTRFDAKLLGGVLNCARGGLGGYGYNYGYSYGKYGYSRYGHYGHYGRYGSGGSYGYGYGYGYGEKKK